MLSRRYRLNPKHELIGKKDANSPHERIYEHAEQWEWEYPVGTPVPHERQYPLERECANNKPNKLLFMKVADSRHIYMVPEMFQDVTWDVHKMTVRNSLWDIQKLRPLELCVKYL